MPGVLQGYDAVLPGLAERIVGWTEEETAFRRRETIARRRWGNFEAVLGMSLGFALAVVALVIAFKLLMAGKSIGGIAAIIGAMVPLIGAFFVVRRMQKASD